MRSECFPYKMDTTIPTEMMIFRLYKMGWCVLCLLICFSDYGQTSDMLIIRHGRSRVRHSTEKNHIRWGLKALDNLTLDYDYDNETMEINGNQSSFDITSSDAFYLNGSSASGVGVGASVGSNSAERIYSPYSTPSSFDYQFRRTNEFGAESIAGDDPTQRAVGTSVVESPASVPAVVKKKIKKKEIMASIRKTVDKGLEYLKSHAHLNEQNMEIDSVRPILERNVNANKNNNDGSSSLKSKDNKIQLPFEDVTSTTVSALALQHSNHPLTDDVEAEQENHVQNDDSLPYLKESHNSTVSAFPSMSSSSVYTSDEENQFSDDNAFVEMKSDKTNTSLPEVESNKQLRHKDKHQQQPRAKLMKTRQRLNKATNISDDSDATVLLTPSRLGGSPDMNAHDELNEGEVDYSSGDTRPSGLYSDNNELPNGADDESIAVPADMSDSFNPNDNESVDDYANLELLDETSRHNRKNLMKGRDVVTQFLQIVETQHLLGANCTAGTDLNLGEGVVDRYAHDRFRVEAEVAVNRANMLTR